MTATQLAIANQPASEAAAKDGTKKATALLDALEKVLYVGEVAEDMEKAFNAIKDHTLSEADKKLDKYEKVKKAKDSLKTVFTMVSQTVQETIDGSLEHGVLPLLGMPLDRIPEGKNADEYFLLATKYEQIGACEPARECLQKVIELDDSKELAKAAKRFMKTRLPRRVINHEAMIQYMSALRYNLTRKEEKAQELLFELEVKHPRFEWPLIPLSSLALREGNADRARHLIENAIQMNPDFVKAWCAKGRLAIAEWRLSALDTCVEKAEALDPNDSGAKALKGMQQFITQNGLRS